MTSAGGDVDWAGAADAQEKNLVHQVGELNVAGHGIIIYLSLSQQMQYFFVTYLSKESFLIYDDVEMFSSYKLIASTWSDQTDQNCRNVFLLFILSSCTKTRMYPE
jgi:hypothetical protein